MKKSIGSLELENVNIFEIIPEVYGDTSSNLVEVFLLEKNTFISDYQGRIYVEANDIFEAFEPDGRFKDDRLWEFVSEGFRPERTWWVCHEVKAR